MYIAHCTTDTTPSLRCPYQRLGFTATLVLLSTILSAWLTSDYSLFWLTSRSPSCYNHCHHPPTAHSPTSQTVHPVPRSVRPPHVFAERCTHRSSGHQSPLADALSSKPFRGYHQMAVHTHTLSDATGYVSRCLTCDPISRDVCLTLDPRRRTASGRSLTVVQVTGCHVLTPQNCQRYTCRRRNTGQVRLRGGHTQFT